MRLRFFKEVTMRTNRIFTVLTLILLLIPSSKLFSQSDEVKQLFEQNLPSVIALSTFGEDNQEISRGTGFLIGEKIMATSYDLVSQAMSAQGVD